MKGGAKWGPVDRRRDFGWFPRPNRRRRYGPGLGVRGAKTGGSSLICLTTGAAAPSLVLQRWCAVRVNSRFGRESGSGKRLCCCFAYCYARGCVRCSSRNVAINTGFAGHADYLGAFFHSRAPIPVNNRQSPVLSRALLLPQLLVALSVICLSGPTNGSYALELAICCS